MKKTVSSKTKTLKKGGIKKVSRVKKKVSSKEDDFEQDGMEDINGDAFEMNDLHFDIDDEEEDLGYYDDQY